MIFSIITNHSPTIIGYPQIRSFTPNIIIQLILHKSYNQITISPKQVILQFVTLHLYPTTPFRVTDYSFTLGKVIDNNPPQVRTTLAFNQYIADLQQHIKEQLQLQIIKEGKVGDWLHSLMPVPHYDESKTQDG